MEIDYRRFTSDDGVGIAVGDLGEGPTTILLHGFASDSETNWVRTGVVKALLDSHRRVLLLDARGHGHSDKPHDPARYGRDRMVNDAQQILHVLEIPRADVVAYSMGSLVAIGLALKEPRMGSLVLGGVGKRQVTSTDPEQAAAVADALEAPDKSVISQARALAFRNFADATGADRFALAASQRAPAEPVSEDALSRIAAPTLVINGENDTMVGKLDSLAQAIPGARFEKVPGDHISAVAKPEFRRAVVDFLAGVPS